MMKDIVIGKAPSVSDGWFSVSYDNSGTGAESITEWVCGYSRAKVVFDTSKISTADGKSISKLSVICGGKEYTASGDTAYTGTVINVETDILAVVTDIDGNSASEKYTVTALPYAPPTLTGASVYRSDSQMSAASTGEYITAIGTAGFTSLNGKNAVTFTAAYKAIGEADFGSETEIVSGTPSVINSSAVSADTGYRVRLKVTDALGNKSTYEQTVPAANSVAFHLKSGGKGAAFGKISETDNALELAPGWSLKLGGTTLTEAQLQALIGLL